MELGSDTEAGVVAKLAQAAQGQAFVLKTDDGRSFLVTPDGMAADEITDPNGMIIVPPTRIVQAVTVQTGDSLVDYVNRFKTADTVLFANIEANKIVAAIDYHAPAQAAHVDHLASLVLPYSVEWKTWTAIDGKLMGQLEFARFLEENAVDVVAPSGADLLEVCRDLQAVRKVDFRKVVRTASDNENFEYVEETDARSKDGSVEIPTKFQLALPVYFGDSPTELYAFLRWKLDDGQLLLGVRLHRPEHVRQAVFKQHVLAAADRTDCPAVFGSHR